MTKEFVAKGARRMAVAFWAILVCGLVDSLAPDGLSGYAAAGIGVITLGYYNTKYAEVLAEILPALMEKFFGKKVK